MLDFGLGGTASPGLGQLLARRIVGSTSVRDVEAEGLAGWAGKMRWGGGPFYHAATGSFMRVYLQRLPSVKSKYSTNNFQKN